MARKIYGKTIAEHIYRYIRHESANLKTKKRPQLGIVHVGNNPASVKYLQKKIEIAGILNFDVNTVNLQKDVEEYEVIEIIDRFNSDPNINGILVQLPINSDNYINPYSCLDRIDHGKDIEGLNQYHTAMLSRGLLHKIYVPCTAAACLSIIYSAGCKLDDMGVVVLGSGITAGRPISSILLWNGASVTTCTRITENIRDSVKQADLVISCIGKPGIISTENFKPGSSFIDCGLHKLDDQTYIGDITLNEITQSLSWYTPVPGGIGPVTVAWLMQNLFESFRRSIGLQNYTFYEQFERIFNNKLHKNNF